MNRHETTCARAGIDKCYLCEIAVMRRRMRVWGIILALLIAVAIVGVSLAIENYR